ncbi:MAG: hypothetical protein K0S33_3108 [Bacteroidetes bacterium]|jgi:uncharacterized membrane protein YidH (DUF202 family)|nr:hypothetical protein [Bacteroidota bacterium]
MRTFGIILIVIGLVMLIIRGVNYTQKEKVVDLGRLEINKEETKTVSWPLYAGGLALVAGIACVVIARKNT